jgi:hypothetical protein
MEVAVTMRSGQRERPRALGARTMCEAFQITAAERAGQRGGRFSPTTC